MRYLILLAILPAVAMATGKPEPPKVDPAPTATSAATSASTSSASSDSHSTASQSQVARGGSASQEQSASADNAGNTQTTSFTSQRSAPSIFAPPAFPAIGCGRGVSLGGSATGGGGIIAFNWNEKDCAAFAKRLSYAQAFAAIDQRVLACQVLLADPMATEIWPQGLPVCEFPATAVEQLSAAPSNEDAEPAADLSAYVTRAELAERDRKLLERATGK